MVKYICTLIPELNKCANFDAQTGFCKKRYEHPCGMLCIADDSPEAGVHEHKERWYEKYYR